MKIDEGPRSARAPVPASILSQGANLIVSIHTALDDEQLTLLQRDLLDRVGTQRAKGVLIDVAALDVLDSFAIRTLADFAYMAQLRGAETVVVGISPADYPGCVLAGVDFQRRWERAAFEAGGGDYRAPAQRVEDFLAGRPSDSLGEVVPSYQPGVRPADLSACLPDYAVAAMREALAVVTINPPAVPLIANVLATPVTVPEAIRARLVDQVTGMVRWRETMLFLKPNGVGTVYEVGAGRVLTGIARRFEGIEACSIGTPDELEAASAALAA